MLGGKKNPKNIPRKYTFFACDLLRHTECRVCTAAGAGSTRRKLLKLSVVQLGQASTEEQ